MKTLFDATTREELRHRIATLNERSEAHWGTMTVYQMLKHCTLWEEMVLQNKKYKRVFIGRLIGRLILKNELKDTPMRQNNPTIPELIIEERRGDIEAQKKKWMDCIEAYARYTSQDFIHPFFGKMTQEQIGYLAYKHADHHLRQFNA